MSTHSPSTPRERVQLALAHKETDRIPIHDTLWSATVDRWQNEGLPGDVRADQYFGYEMAFLSVDMSPMYPVRVIEESQHYIVETTPYGGVRKNHLDRSTTPELIDYGIKTRADWEAAKARLTPNRERLGPAFQGKYEWARTRDLFLAYNVITGFDNLQSYIRTDEVLPLLLTDPGLIRDMTEAVADLAIEQARLMIREGYQFDGVYIYNDMGYRKAPFFAPRLYRELFQPADRRMFDFFHTQGWQVILHSCGNVRPLVPDLIAAGIDCLNPLEVKAGMDLVELKREFGQDLAFMGGIDVRAMNDSEPGAIEREIAAKIPVAMKGGGYIYHSDHSIPSDVSFAQYGRVLHLVSEYGQFGLPGRH